MAILNNGLEVYDACWCAGTGCGGHLKIRGFAINWTLAVQPTAAQGVAFAGVVTLAPRTGGDGGD